MRLPPQTLKVNRPRRTWLYLTVWVVLATISACTAPSSEDIPDARVTQALNKLQGLSLNDNVVLMNAHVSVIESCLRSKGWDVDYPVHTFESLFGGISLMSNATAEAFLFDDPDQAAEQGYGFQALGEVLAGRERARSQHRPLSTDSLVGAEAERYHHDLYGLDSERFELTMPDGSITEGPGGGCEAEADGAVYGDYTGWLLLQEYKSIIGGDVWQDVTSDGGLSQSLAAWRRCMDRRGLEALDPMEARQIASEDFDVGVAPSPEALKHERRVASSDAECNQEAGVRAAFTRAFLTAAGESLSDSAEVLTDIVDAEQAALDRATALLIGDS